MPKRIIDGDALWVSDKLATVPEKYRAEYAWLLPLAQVNGCFECSPMLVWRTCYSALRPDWNIESVAVMLDEFEAAKMLFRFKTDGKTYGFFPGVQKEGRLPSASERAKYRAPWGVGMIPAKELASFLGVTPTEVSTRYRGLLLDVSKKNRRASLIGIGIGSGIGVGTGRGVGMGVGVGSGNGDEAASLPSPESTTPSLNNSSIQEDDNSSDNNSTTPKPWANLTGSGFVKVFRAILTYNPKFKASALPSNWQKLWEDDMYSMIKRGSREELYNVLVISQSEGKREYYLRTKSILDNYDKLVLWAGEKKKQLPALRRQFRDKVEKASVLEDDRKTLVDFDDDDEDESKWVSKYPVRDSI